MAAGWPSVLGRALADWRKASQRRAVFRELHSVNPRLVQDVGAEAYPGVIFVRSPRAGPGGYRPPSLLRIAGPGEVHGGRAAPGPR